MTFYQSQNKVVESGRIFFVKYYFSVATLLEIGTKAFFEVGIFGIKEVSYGVESLRSLPTKTFAISNPMRLDVG